MVTICFSLTPISLFIDIWTYNNDGDSDIYSRANFMAGMLLEPSAIFSFVLWSIISIILFRKTIQFRYILLSIFVNLIVSSLLIFSGLAFLPIQLLNSYIPYGDYLFLCSLLFFSIILIIKYKRYVRQQKHRVEENTPESFSSIPE